MLTSQTSNIFFFGLTRPSLPLLDAAIGWKAGSFSTARQSGVFVVDHPEPRLGAEAGNSFSLKALSGEQKAQEENPNLPFTPSSSASAIQQPDILLIRLSAGEGSQALL